MRILLLAPTYPGSAGTYSAKALKELGHAVLAYDYRQAVSGKNYYLYPRRTLIKKIFDRLIKPVQRMNRKILHLALEYRPDLILSIKGDLIYPDTIRILTVELGFQTFTWYQDGAKLLETRPSNRNILSAMQYYNISFFGDIQGIPETIRKSIQRVEFLTFGCDPQVHKTWDLTEAERSYYGSDLCFVGNPRGDSHRDEILFDLQEYSLKIWGWGWQKKGFPQGSMIQFMGPAYADVLAKVYSASRIALNINDDWPYMNYRNFEAPACGILLLTSQIPDLDRCFNIGKEIVTFDGKKDLKEKINHFLSHADERLEIARAGQVRTHRDHTNRQRMEHLLSFLPATSKVVNRKRTDESA